MLISYNDLRQFAVEATDGRKGHATDLYFDDESWQVRYAVTESGFLFTKQEALVKSAVLGEPDIDSRTLPVSLTKEQLEEADSPDAHPPVSEQREREIRLHQLEFWPPVMIGAPGAVYTPAIAEQQLRTAGKVTEQELEELAETEDSHLRSLDEMSGYAIQATDGDIGVISDFLLDPNGWKIRYVVVDTGNWLPGRQVAIKPDWVSRVSWVDQSLVVNVSKEEVSDAQELSEIEELERSDTHLAVAPYGAYGGYPM
jgi:hypothetical protein